MTAEVTFDALIHAPYRLRICALLSAAGMAEFRTLRQTLEVSDSVLSKHLAPLTEAGYVTTKHSLELGRQRRRLWVSLTPQGRRAFDAHARALQQILTTGDLPA